MGESVVRVNFDNRTRWGQPIAGAGGERLRSMIAAFSRIGGSEKAGTPHRGSGSPISSSGRSQATGRGAS